MNATSVTTHSNDKNNNNFDKGRVEFTALPIRIEEYLMVRKKQFELIEKRGRSVSLTDTITEIIKKGINLVNE